MFLLIGEIQNTPVFEVGGFLGMKYGLCGF